MHGFSAAALRTIRIGMIYPVRDFLKADDPLAAFTAPMVDLPAGMQRQPAVEITDLHGNICGRMAFGHPQAGSSSAVGGVMLKICIFSVYIQ